MIVLAFSNNRDDYLQNIVQERKAVFRALQDYDDKRYIKVHTEDATAIDDVFDVVNRYADRIAIFHFGGHADGAAIQLEAGGNAEQAHADGLARMLGAAKNLKLVFLNGCATSGQAEGLIANGVKVVIATAVPINDSLATLFAEKFYAAMGTRKTIFEAFELARAAVATTAKGAARHIGDFRGVGTADARARTASPELVWGLYVHPGGEAALSWKLPEQAEQQLIIRGASYQAAAGPLVNAGLITALANAIAPHNKKVRRALEDEQESRDPDIRNIRSPSVAAFPTPVGEQLRILFHEDNETISSERLQQLVLVYETATQLFAFAALSQLWDVLSTRPECLMTDTLRTACERFVAMSATTAASFDYFDLILKVADFFAANGISHYMRESDEFVVSLRDEPSVNAHLFMEAMRGELRGKVSGDEITSFCVQTETHLSEILKDFAFVVNYMMAAIKDITLVKSRNKMPEFSHKIVQLDQAGVGARVLDKQQLQFSDSRSVLLVKDIDNISNNLNLMPFILDENALTGAPQYRLFFYSHHDCAADTYHYWSINNPADKLVVSDAKYKDVKSLFEDFKRAIAAAPGAAA